MNTHSAQQLSLIASGLVDQFGGNAPVAVLIAHDQEHGLSIGGSIQGGPREAGSMVAGLGRKLASLMKEYASGPEAKEFMDGFNSLSDPMEGGTTVTRE